MLYRSAFQDVCRLLERLGIPRQDRGDVAQEVFLQAHKSQARYDARRGSRQIWLQAITVHIASHYRERAHLRRERLSDGPELDVADQRSGAHEALETHETSLLVAEILGTLPPDLRRVLVAKDAEGLSMEAIADDLGVPLSTAYKKLYRGRLLVERAWRRRERLEGRPPPGAGVDPPAAPDE